LFGFSPTPRPIQNAVYPLRKPDEEYLALGDYPSLHHRYLAVFRLWNSVNYFHAYKTLIENWDTALLEALPKYISIYFSARLAD